MLHSLVYMYFDIHVHIVVLRDTCTLTGHLRAGYFPIFCITNIRLSIYSIFSLEFPLVLVMIYLFHKLINYAIEIYIIIF